MTSYSSAPAGSTAPHSNGPGGPPLTDGPRWYRARIRSWGPLLGVVLPGLIGAIAYFALEFSDASWSGALGLVGGVAAAPGLLLVGAPFGDSGLYVVAIAISAIMWMGIGLFAARRATRNPLATWADYWRHYLWMAGGIWVGAALALGIATISLGEALF